MRGIWPHRIGGQGCHYVFTRKENAGVHRHIQRRGSGPDVQPDERACIPRGERQSQCRPVYRGRPVHTQRMVQLPEVHPRTVQPIEHSPRAQIRMQRAEVLSTMLYGCVTCSPRACHYDTLGRAHHKFLTRSIGWRKHNRADHAISYPNTLVKTGSKSIVAILRRRWMCLRDLWRSWRIRDCRKL